MVEIRNYFTVELPAWGDIADGGLYLTLSLVLLCLGKVVFGWAAPYKLDEQLGDRDNKAVAVCLAGFLLSLALVLAPFLAHDSGQPLGADVGQLVFWSMLGLVLLLWGQWINDKVIFRAFSNSKELAEDGNVGLGVALAGSFLGIGFLLRGVLSGEEANLAADLAGTLVFFVAGMGCFLGLVELNRRLSPYDLVKELEADNPAVGVLEGCKFVALGLVLGGAAQASDSLVFFVFWAVIGSALLWVGQWIVDGIVLPKHDIGPEVAGDRNWGIAALVGLLIIGLAVFIRALFFFG